MLTPDPDIALAHGLFTVAQARASGLTEAQILRLLRKGTWERLMPGILRVVGRSEHPADELLVALLRLGPTAVAGYESAAGLLAWDFRTPHKPQIIVGTGVNVRRHYGADVHRVPVGRHEMQMCGPFVLTTPTRTALDIATVRGRDVAVAALEAGMRKGDFERSEIERLFGASRRKGIRRAREALAAADELSGSPAETRARLLFLDAGLPRPVSQFAVRSNGRFIARVDFAWPQFKVIVEIDGFAYHSASDAFQRDRTRQNHLVLLGWTVLRFTVADLLQRPEVVVALVSDALARGCVGMG